MPAKAGTSGQLVSVGLSEVPAFAGMTGEDDGQSRIASSR
jgi:hypothetical protein